MLEPYFTTPIENLKAMLLAAAKLAAGLDRASLPKEAGL
jgi:hypothetical protein